MAHPSSDLPLRKFFDSDAEKSEVKAVLAHFEIPLSNASTRDLEEGINGTDNTDGNVSRADGGRDAWLFLAACFLFEALIWGFPFAFGVFQTYYSTHSPFDEHASGIAVIGTCATGITLVAASFATEVWHLIVTQGFLYAIGGSLLYSPTMFYLDQWFGT
ncbi:hypothetical protein ACHAPF_007627 [Botrytis cinerea]